MVMDFSKLKGAIAKQFANLSKHQLYRLDVSGDAMWDTYIKSFPEGTNLIYKERTEHDCNCCKQFIRAVGNVAAIIDGKIVSLWDINVGDTNYQEVVDALKELLSNKPIKNEFYHFEKTAGTDFNHTTSGETVVTHSHFFVNIPPAYFKRGEAIASLLGETRALHDVLARSLNELDLESIDIVSELIAQNSLYRGEEHKFAVAEFKKVKAQYDKLKTDEAKEFFVWENCKKLNVSISKFRNTVIGTLVTDIASGVDLEDAVKMFESKVAPNNYKRPTALVTKGMIEKAKAKVEEMGLTSALSRRYAKITDITLNNLLFANRDTKKALDGDVFSDLISKTSTKKPNLDKVEEVSIETFVTDILPTVKSVSVLLENTQQGNMVSLVAPVDPTAGKLFKWDNNFTWSYNGEVADSIKERVKQAGGSVEGDLCCRLAWEYKDDLDFHMYEPDGNLIYFSNRGRKSDCGGVLDVDANGMDGLREHPVENIFYKDKSKMREGVYKLVVNNYTRRSDGRGFEVEIEFGGTQFNFVYEGVIKAKEDVTVAEITYSRIDGFSVKSKLTSTQSSKEVWGLDTQQYHPVKAMMLSPNYWDGQGVGNKHYFFMIEGCNNPDTTRGFYNEFLSNELTEHRKVFEVVGSSMKTEKSDEQLSGLGFSSTKQSSIILRVEGTFTRNIKVNF